MLNSAATTPLILADALSFVFALALYARNRKHGLLWLFAAAFMVAQAVSMWFAPFVPSLGPMSAAYALILLGLTASGGIAAGTQAG